MRTLLDTSCLVCAYPHTINGHICALCLTSRYGTIHPNWNSPVYLLAMQEAVQALDERSAYEMRRRAAARQEGKAA